MFEVIGYPKEEPSLAYKRHLIGALLNASSGETVVVPGKRIYSLRWVALHAKARGLDFEVCPRTGDWIKR